MLTEKLKVKGRVTLLITHEDGSTETFIRDNLVVSTGLAYITSRMVGTTSPVISHMGIGETATAPLAANVDLGSPTFRETTAVSIEDETVTDDSVEYTSTFAAGDGDGAIVEAGLFNSDSGGTMLSRVVFGLVTKTPTDALTITWRITIADS